MSKANSLIQKIEAQTKQDINEVREIMDWQHLADAEVVSIAMYALKRNAKEVGGHLK
jgi:hypothetical protein